MAKVVRSLFGRRQTTVAASFASATCIMIWYSSGLVAVGWSDVKPIFSKHCVSCHSGKDPSGGLNLSSYAGAMKGGRSGKAVIPGDAGSSLLIKMIKGEREPRMPMGTKPLSEREIAKLSAWINAGAKE